MRKFLHTRFPFRIFFSHRWRYFSDGLKRDCLCGCEEWVMTRPYPLIGEAKSFWADVSRKPFIR